MLLIYAAPIKMDAAGLFIVSKKGTTEAKAIVEMIRMEATNGLSLEWKKHNVRSGFV